MNGSKWSDEEMRLAGKMHRAGLSNTAIAGVLGRSPSAVKHFISRQRKVDPGRWRVISYHGKRSEQPCWTCYYGGGRTDPVTHFKCPWADKDLHAPVEGWTATKVPYYVKTTNAPMRIDVSYEIHDCPHYIEEGKRSELVRKHILLRK